MRKAVFLDRDGVINELLHNHTDPIHPSNYVTRWEQFRFIDGVKDAIRKLIADGYMVIVVSNQSGIGRGYCKSDEVVSIMLKMCEQVDSGVNFDFYFCPHVPDVRCACRKPRPGMLFRAAIEHRIALDDSWVIGDRPEDIAAGIYAGIHPGRCIMIGGSLGRGAIVAKFHTAALVFQPRVEANLLDAVGYIRAADMGLELPRVGVRSFPQGEMN